MRRVLVAYATRHGATRAIAVRLGQVMSVHGVEVVVAEVGGAPDPAGFDGVVLGSPANGGRWLPEAGHWGRLHARALIARSLWLFSSAPPEPGPSPAQPPTGPLRLAARLGAREHALFGGCPPPERGPMGRRLVDAVSPTGRDCRDWTAIEAWGWRVVTQLVRTRRSPA